MFAVIAATLLVPSIRVPEPAAVRKAAERALPLLAKAASTHAEKKTCFGCHNQAFPAVAFAAGRDRGFDVAKKLIESQSEHIHDFLTTNRDAYKSGKGTGGQVDTAGWALHTLAALGREPDDTTTAVVEYLLQKDESKGNYRCSSDRPPSESSSFGTNYVAVHGLQKWATTEQKERAAKRLAAVREWAEKTPAKDTEDRVFRVRLLKLLNEDAKLIAEASKELAAGQHINGGWSQKDGMPTDAYATGTALAALHEAGGTRTDSLSYRRGLGYLLREQREDGSWFLISRSKPFQPYYEGGFPYEKNQFISSTASGWAATALLLACSPSR